jgi:hypothetical protein
MAHVKFRGGHSKTDSLSSRIFGGRIQDRHFVGATMIILDDKDTVSRLPGSNFVAEIHAGS